MSTRRGRWLRAMSVLGAVVLVSACGRGDDGDEGVVASPTGVASSATATRAVTTTPSAGATAAPTESAPATTPVAASATPQAAATKPPVPTAPPAATAVPTKAPVGSSITVVGFDLKFSPTSLRAQANAPITVTLDNQDVGVQHDIEFYNSGGGRVGGTELVLGPATISTTFTVTPGVYPFKCSVHPQVMRGVLTAE